MGTTPCLCGWRCGEEEGEELSAPPCTILLLLLTVVGPLVLWVVAFWVLHRLVPLDKKLPKVMEPFALMKGVERWCWLGYTYRGEWKRVKRFGQEARLAESVLAVEFGSSLESEVTESSGRLPPKAAAARYWLPSDGREASALRLLCVCVCVCQCVYKC